VINATLFDAEHHWNEFERANYVTLLNFNLVMLEQFF